MCACTPAIRTPFCGKLNCTWPKPSAQDPAFEPGQRCSYCKPCRSSFCDCGPCVLPDCPKCPPRMCRWHITKLMVGQQAWLDSSRCRPCALADPKCQECGGSTKAGPCEPCYDRASEGAGGDS